ACASASANAGSDSRPRRNASAMAASKQCPTNASITRSNYRTARTLDASDFETVKQVRPTRNVIAIALMGRSDQRFAGPSLPVSGEKKLSFFVYSSTLKANL